MMNNSEKQERHAEIPLIIFRALLFMVSNLVVSSVVASARMLILLADTACANRKPTVIRHCSQGFKQLGNARCFPVRAFSCYFGSECRVLPPIEATFCRSGRIALPSAAPWRDISAEVDGRTT